jgi:hypothetical protein
MSCSSARLILYHHVFFDPYPDRNHETNQCARNIYVDELSFMVYHVLLDQQSY